MKNLSHQEDETLDIKFVHVMPAVSQKHKKFHSVIPKNCNIAKRELIVGSLNTLSRHGTFKKTIKKSLNKVTSQSIGLRTSLI